MHKRRARLQGEIMVGSTNKMVLTSMRKGDIVENELSLMSKDQNVEGVEIIIDVKSIERELSIDVKEDC